MKDNKKINVTYFFDTSQSVRKSIILYKQVGSVASPIMYFTKPKWVKNEDFLQTFKEMQIYLREE